MAAQVAHDTARIALQPFQCFAHGFELHGIGIATNLQRKPRGKSGVGLPQIHPGRLCQFRELTARTLVQPGVRWIDDVLFHCGRVDDHALGTVLNYNAGLLRGLDPLGQQRFDSLVADPPPSALQRRRIHQRAMLEESLPGEVLVIEVLDPACDSRPIRQPIGAL